MLGTYPNARALPRPLPWPAVLRRPKAQQGTPAKVRRHQALGHAVMGAVKASSLCAALMAASAVVGASKGPVVLSEPSQPLVAHVAAAAPAASAAGAGLAAKVTTR